MYTTTTILHIKSQKLVGKFGKLHRTILAQHALINV